MSAVVPDYMNALVGYRAWNVTPEGDLISINSNTAEPWPAKAKKQAICTTMSRSLAWTSQLVTSVFSTTPMYSVGDAFERVWGMRKHEREMRTHFAPMPNCTCGIYAAKDGESDELEGYKSYAAVWGEVYLWGKIQEYTEGYRAEFAYPKSLSIRANSSNLAPKIAERYGVPCAVVESEKSAKEHVSVTLMEYMLRKLSPFWIRG